MSLQNGPATIPSANQFYFDKLTKIEKRCQTEMAQHKGIIDLFFSEHQLKDESFGSLPRRYPNNEIVEKLAKEAYLYKLSVNGSLPSLIEGCLSLKEHLSITGIINHPEFKKEYGEIKEKAEKIFLSLTEQQISLSVLETELSGLKPVALVNNEAWDSHFESEEGDDFDLHKRLEKISFANAKERSCSLEEIDWSPAITPILNRFQLDESHKTETTTATITTELTRKLHPSG